MFMPEGRIELIYVDSNSSDRSVQTARQMGARVIVLQDPLVTAAVARNAGWRAVSGPLILFLDGDCVIHSEFVFRAMPKFVDPRVAAVFGCVSELNRATSYYHSVLELDLISCPPGRVKFFGGNAIVRRSALVDVGGLNPAFIATEEVELSASMRRGGWEIVSLDTPMVEHDGAVARWPQYFRRAMRMGYGYAQLEAGQIVTEPFGSNKARANRIWGVVLILVVLASVFGSVVCGSLVPFGLTAGIITFQALRIARRSRPRATNTTTCLIYGIFWVLKQLPMSYGQLLYRWDQRTGRKRGWIEYR
jgi:cellulose synthase/poly-beta-1,6-N-acetylglucosamine synthase-like glycosyltransferase